MPKQHISNLALGGRAPGSALLCDCTERTTIKGDAVRLFDFDLHLKDLVI